MAVLDSKKPSRGAWDFTAELTDDGGLAIKNAANGSYTFATDIRVVRVWASNSSPSVSNSVSKSYVLGSADCPSMSPAIAVNTSPTVSLIRPYTPSLEVSAGFQTKDPVLSPKGQRLKLEQSYVFTEYSKTPAHEPGGIVTGARCYPLVKFSYRGDASELPALRYLRFDYRIDVSVDASIVAATQGKVSNENQAGLFADYDTLHIPPTIGNVFARAEKPLQREVIGQGLQVGLGSYWDNIHQWGTSAGMPATPGAFHAAHTHWRWAAISATGVTGLLPGGSQFAGVGGPGGPLIDPRVPRQSLRFAVTGRGTANTPLEPKWAASANPSTPKFDDLFTGARSPGDVKDGAILTQWFSIEVERSDEDIRNNPTWEGAVFVHGYFFTHDEEDLQALGPAAGVFAATLGGLKDPLLKEDATYGSGDWVRH